VRQKGGNSTNFQSRFSATYFNFKLFCTQKPSQGAKKLALQTTFIIFFKIYFKNSEFYEHVAVVRRAQRNPLYSKTFENDLR
jgi:hypothetical protein